MTALPTYLTHVGPGHSEIEGDEDNHLGSVAGGGSDISAMQDTVGDLLLSLGELRPFSTTSTSPATLLPTVTQQRSSSQTGSQFSRGEQQEGASSELPSPLANLGPLRQF